MGYNVPVIKGVSTLNAWPANMAVGDLVVTFVFAGNNTTSVSASPNNGTNGSDDSLVTAPGGNNPFIFRTVRVVTGSETATRITFSPSTPNKYAHVHSVLIAAGTYDLNNTFSDSGFDQNPYGEHFVTDPVTAPDANSLMLVGFFSYFPAVEDYNIDAEHYYIPDDPSWIELTKLKTRNVSWDMGISSVFAISSQNAFSGALSVLNTFQAARFGGGWAVNVVPPIRPVGVTKFLLS